jgi:hypothetical protein
MKLVKNPGRKEIITSKAFPVATFRHKNPQNLACSAFDSIRDERLQVYTHLLHSLHLSDMTKKVVSL